ncbi:hypothetical protein EDB83DRAFT_2325597 [Lactarius deliciosus]|nr:hypothetical protein EDB83DRAFT_2325597 [Lactarius deliciosus]
MSLHDASRCTCADRLAHSPPGKLNLAIRSPLKLGLSQADILSFNSGISCDGPIPAGKVLCIKQPMQQSLLAQKPAPACKTQATATDTTCDALATKFGLTRQKFVEYNDNVNSDCTNLSSRTGLLCGLGLILGKQHRYRLSTSDDIVRIGSPFSVRSAKFD